MRNARRNRFAVLLPVAVLTVLLWFFTAVNELDAGQREQGRLQLEQSLRRAAAASYASRGEYPATLDELAAQSGIRIDRENYAVFYEAFASNLMPDITVLVKET
ncbi:MAG: hypothetical protein IJB75_00275 [Oscillospiraceae bacterium]|nr:hypothetical protein [Oscillospiraceae bacterium]